MSAARLVALLTTALLAGVAADASAHVFERPSKAQMERQTRAAVRASRAEIIALRVDQPSLSAWVARHGVTRPNRTYALTVRAADPAAYLESRIDGVVDVVVRLTNVQWRFETRYLAVVDRSGARVFWVRQIRRGSRETTAWNVRPGLRGCAENIGFGLEVDPDGTAPSCPA